MCLLMYIGHMRTMVDVDDEALAAAAAELGTESKRDTINTALRLIANRRQRAVQVKAAALLFGDPIGMRESDVVAELSAGRGRRRER
jgi:Arc/MetJ family transcription regulator